MGDSSTTDRPDIESRLPDEDVLSVHGEGLTGHLTFEGRPSWSGGVVDSEDPLIGTTLHETYQVSRVIGEGGMGRVYEARHTRIASKRYAIKVLHTEFARNPEIRSRFQHEAEAAAKIGHPGVVGTYDLGETPGERPYMVCEYLAGEDLNDYLTERGALPAHTVVHIGIQLCSAIAEAHARGVIHRDLKPHNVFVLGEEGPPSKGIEREDDELPSVKVLDFGLSRFMERDNDLTKTGIILGTPGYMAPEQAGGLGTDHRTDIYGIGALLYAMATGRPPHKEESPQKTVISVLSHAPIRPRELVATIPIDLEIVIQRAMAREPDERYQSAEDVGAALAQLSAASTIFDRRARGQRLGAPRVRLLLLTTVWLILGLPSLGLALLGLLQARGFDYANFRPSTLEWLLLSLLVLVTLFPVGLLARRFYKRVWNDSARVADLLPKMKRPLLAGVVAYGISALVVLSAWGVHGLRMGQLGYVPQAALLSWFLVLPVNALLAATAAVIVDASRKVESPFVRLLASVGYSAGAAVAALVLLILAALGPRTATSDGRVAAEASSAEASPLAPLPTEGETTQPVARAEEARKVSPSPSLESRKRAPEGALVSAKSSGPEALEALLEEYPQDGKILEALVLAHASRADTLERSVETISRLFRVEPELAKKADILFILKKGLLARGQAFATALDVVRDHMGTDGGELAYQLLGENPKQADRLKKVFFELRKTKQVTPETAIAFDLRYAPSCRGRVALLERAERDGDLRSVHQLQALSTAPKRCGWGRKCEPLCPAEAKEFRQSIKVIQARLDGVGKSVSSPQ